MLSLVNNLPCHPRYHFNSRHNCFIGLPNGADPPYVRWNSHGAGCAEALIRWTKSRLSAWIFQVRTVNGGGQRTGISIALPSDTIFRPQKIHRVRSDETEPDETLFWNTL
jgi:hypothetical protein